MECTQKLEYTQELYESRTERVCSEQIGFLGICGEKYPVKKGPNKIGRDPSTCTIVLNLNSVSRQHAVINVLNQNEFMLMDLDSANKTKLMNKNLQPYIPHPLKNGDMVQFGDIFGVFRLLEEDNDLPMTQAIDLPDTPIPTRHLSKLNKVQITTIPESPDVSDRDDSFIAPSQAKGGNCLTSSNNHFIKPTSKVISIQPIGTNKIDNIYWSSSKKSVSLNSHLDESNCDLLNSNVSHHPTPKQNNDLHNMETQPFIPVRNYNISSNCGDSVKFSLESKKDVSIYDMETQQSNNNIFDMETQVPYVDNKSPEKKESIYDMQTQALTGDFNERTVDPIYTANTQIPSCTSIHSLPTQLTEQIKERFPEVCKIDNQQNMQFNLFTSSKDKEDKSNDEGQRIFSIKNDVKTNNYSNESTSKITGKFKNTNASDEEISFEETDSQNLVENFESQTLLPPLEDEENAKITKISLGNKSTVKITMSENEKNNKINGIVDSDSSTDCEDIAILPTQKITNNQEIDEDLTDCEDMFNNMPTKENKKTASITDIEFEDMLTQVIDENENEKMANNYSNTKLRDDNIISEMPTQVVDADENQVHKDISFEDLPTQVINEDITSKTTEIYENKPIESPFKIPLLSPIKVRRKDFKPIVPKQKPFEDEIITVLDDNNYYAATQDIVKDLCSQRISSPEDSILISKDKINSEVDDDELIPCSVENYKTGQRFPHLESPEKKICNRSFDSNDGEESVSKLVSNLSNQQIRDVIGIDPSVDKFRKVPSDPSDVESTPKKLRPIKFMDIDLPDSQEIKTTVSLHLKSVITESSSESEPENDSQEQYTPILFRKKRKPKNKAKTDLTKKFEFESLPTRVITRVRKPTSRLQNNDNDARQLTNNILKPKFLSEQEDEIDKDIISENISRLKNKTDKNKNKDIYSKKTTYESTGGKENVKKADEYIIKPKTGTDKSHNSNKESKETILVKGEESIKKTKIESVSDDKTKTKEISIINHINIKREPRQKKKLDQHNTTKNISNVGIEDGSNKDVNQSNISARSTRSSRTRRSGNTKEKICVEEHKSKPRTRKEVTKTPVEIDSTLVTLPDVVRRSKRQRTSREKKEEKTTERIQKPKSILKRGKVGNHEQSAVYSVSSESSTESPKSMKRSATNDLDLPSSKRTKSAVVSNSMSLRSTPVRMNRTQYVLFTAFPCEEVRSKLEKLGAIIVTDVMSCTVVLTLNIKRTFKLLCALGLGKPIVGPDWVQACADSNMVVDPWLYVLKDEAAEKRFQFSLERVLRSKRNFLQGFNVSATSSVMPNATEMKLIVECSGGTWKEGGPQWICVSCTADKALWPSMKRKGAIVVSTEFILGGVLRQRADITNNKL